MENLQHYKNSQNVLYAIEPQFAHMLPTGCVPITDEEADRIRASQLPPAPVPTVTALQGLLAINQAGLAVSYEAWANNPARTFAEKAFINKAQTWRRDDPTLVAAASALGISPSQLDGLFALAATL